MSKIITKMVMTTIELPEIDDVFRVAFGKSDGGEICCQWMGTGGSETVLMKDMMGKEGEEWVKKFMQIMVDYVSKSRADS